MRSTFRLLFYVNRQKVKANGKCPIMGRITLDGKVCQYSTGQEVLPALWNADTGRVVTKGAKVNGFTPEEMKRLDKINSRLDELERQARNAYAKYVDTTGYVSAEIIKNVVTGQAQAKETLVALIDEHNREYARRVGIDRVRHTYLSYLAFRMHVYNFLLYKYSVEDVSLRSLEMQFIHDFRFYLSTVLKMKTGPQSNYLIFLRKIARIAVKQRTLKYDPFSGYKVERPPIQFRNLTGEQLAKIMGVGLHTYRLCHTRDLFVFSVFTGLGRADLANLTWDHITTKSDGSQWISIARQKTGAECHIKLLDIPIRIMDKYRGEGKDNKIFHVPQTHSLNDSLKEIADICSLGYHLTFYVARHTFATETCLSNGVPIETISKMMGHSKIKTTQIYAEITNHKVSRDLGKLSAKTRNMYSIQEDNAPQRIGWYGNRKNYENTPAVREIKL